MTRLSWAVGPIITGLDCGVVYFNSGLSEVWNGLISIDEAEEVSSRPPRYIDGQKVMLPQQAKSFSAKLSAYSSPAAIALHAENGALQVFDFTYRAQLQDGHQIHLVYGATFIPGAKNYSQAAASPDIWNITTKPRKIPGAKGSAHLIIDTTEAYKTVSTILEDMLYGSDDAVPRMPSPTELDAIFEENSILRVTDHGDGTFSVSGPDEAIQMLDATTFRINWPSAVYINAETYTIKSL